MVQDFAKIRAAAQEKTAPAAAPANWALLFTGLFTGLALGVFISFLVYLSGVLPPAGQQSTAQMALDATTQQEEQALAQQRLNEDLERAAARLQLEFYQELPNYEVIVNTLPVAAPVIPRQQTPATNANVVDTVATDTSGSSAAADLARTIAELTGTQANTSAPSTSPAIAGASSGGVSYMIQAGAFQQEPAATVQSNRLIGLGLDARVKKEALLGKTLFLVQAGPYTSREQLSQVERILRSNNIDSMRITLGGM